MASSPDHLTPQVMTAILRQHGCLPQFGSVASVRSEPIGAGLMGDALRFHLEYSGERGSAPTSLVGKFAAQDEVARKTGSDLGLYMTETRFYQEIAPRVRVRAPVCYSAEIDAETHKFCILLEDAAPARAEDQLTGCSFADAQHAMRQAAALHAPFFNDESLWSISWMQKRKMIFADLGRKFGTYMEIFRERYADMLEPEFMIIAQRFAEKAEQFLTRAPERYSLIHADYRLDNMLFDCRGGEVPLMVLDWQCAAPENPGLDTAYFLGTSYPIEHRARDERTLLALYWEELGRHGVNDYSFDQVWQDYRRGAWLGFFTAIFSSTVAKRNERSDQLFMQFARGAAAQMRDHDTLSMA